MDYPPQLDAMVGQEIGASEWLLVDQDRIDGFAEVTGDHQWIHSDVDKAALGPFGSTIAHGFLTLSMAEAAMVRIGLPGLPSPRMLVNYGTDRLRFLAPVRAGSRIRTRAAVASVATIAGGPASTSR